VGLEKADKIEPVLAVLLAIAATTGARRGELCALRWKDLDWESRTLTFTRSVYETKGGGWSEKSTKTHAVRTVGLDHFGVAVLRRHRSDVDSLAAELGLKVASNAFMFSRSPVGSEPIRPDLVTKFTIRGAKAAGIDTPLHAFRHFSVV
jgi:integrase